MMDLQWLTPEFQSFLVNAGANMVGGLATGWVNQLVRAGGARLRREFSAPPLQEALERAATAAITATVADWQLAAADYEDVWERFGGWLVEPVVLGEFRVLLAPTAEASLDIELLREEFEAAGLEVATLGLPDFDALVQDMIGAFYMAASSEPLLEAPFKIGFLRQIADQIGALQRIADRQLALGGQTVDELQQLKQLAQLAVDDSARQTELLDALVNIMSRSSQSWLELQATFRLVVETLQTAQLDVIIGENGRNIAIGQNIQQHVDVDISQVEQLLVDIRDRLIHRQPRLTTDELSALETRYRHSIVERFKTLTFQGMSPTGTPIALPLKKVYVELKAVANLPEAADTYSADERRLLLEAEEEGRYERGELIAHLDAMRLERWRASARKGERRSSTLQRRSIGELVNDSTQRGLVILGDPGSGKSTLLHYLALTHASQANGGLLPIFVPFAAYDDYRTHAGHDTSLGDFLAIYYHKWRSQVGLAPLFAAALEAGRALVLLDGLDEVLETTMRQHVADQAGALIQQWQGRGNRFVVTSRVLGYREARLPGNLPHVTVLDFGMPEIELFAHQWCRAYEVWVAGARETPTALREAAAQEKALLDEVRANPSVEQLAANPLLLTMLALLRRQVGKLPDRRIQLYDKYLETMIIHWGTGRSLGARTQKVHRFDPHKAEAYLIDLAFWLQCNRPSGTATRYDLEQQLVEICLRFKQIEPARAAPEQQLAAVQEAEAFVRDMRHFAGLLAERGRDAFGFLHLTFQEYFAGRALARISPEECWAQIQPRLHQPRWREPILLCAGQLGIKEQRPDWATDLAQRILEADSEHEAILHRDVFLAASVAADDVGIKPALLESLHARLAPLLHASIPIVRDMAIIGLAHLARVGVTQTTQTLLTTLADPGLRLPVIAVTALLLGDSALDVLYGAVRQCLSDDNWQVRGAAVAALGPLAAVDEQLKAELQTWLGMVNEYFDEGQTDRILQVLIDIYASLLASDQELRQQFVSRLDAPDWQSRHAAARALIAMPGGAPVDLWPRLRALLDDQRGEESWPNRLQIAELFVNERDRDLSQEAIATALAALNYATQPWYNLPRSGAAVRSQAAMILGRLDPIYRDKAIFARLVQVMNEDKDADVRDAAYGALLRLAAAPEAPVK
jgi:hypothetical protein